MRFADDKEVKERVKKPLNEAEVSEGKRYESELRLFTELKKKEDAEKEMAYKSFIGFTTTALSEQAHERIRDFMIFPLSAVGISRGLISDLYKVFNAGNSFFAVNTVKNNGGDKLQALMQTINLNDWIEETGKNVLKNQPNTFVVVDKDEDGEPYLIAVDNKRLIDFKFKEDKKTLEYITFIHSEETNEDNEEVVKYALYDEEKYYVIEKVGSKDLEVIKSVEHGLDYVPARMFLTEPLNSDSKLNRYTPLALGITKLKEWQYFDIYQFYTDHHAPFPVTEQVRQNCGNADCKSGIIEVIDKYEVDNEMQERTIRKPCKECQGLNSLGVGAKIMLEPQTEKDEATASGKFRFINNDVENLEYIKKKLKELEQGIKLKVVGVDDIITREAINKDQVQGSFESRENILLNVKNTLDGLYVWIAETLAGLYIKGCPVSVSANYGTEWYLIKEDDLQKRFETAKNSGMPIEEVKAIYYQLIETKYKGNPNKLKRAKILNQLNPCPFSSLDDKIKLKSAGVLSLEDFVMSNKILDFVNKFEAEQGSILEFGANEEQRIQVLKIKEIIKKYTDEYIKENKTEPVSGGDGANE